MAPYIDPYIDPYAQEVTMAPYIDPYIDPYAQEVTMAPYIDPYVSYSIDPLSGSVLSENTYTSDLGYIDPISGAVLSEDIYTSDLGYIDPSSGSVPLDNTNQSALDWYFADNTDWSLDLIGIAYDPLFDPSSDSYGFGLLDSSSLSHSDYLDFAMEANLEIAQWSTISNIASVGLSFL